MYRKKIAIYVEGQTEQALLRHLILVQSHYAGVKIQNIKLIGSNNQATCKVRSHDPLEDSQSLIFFLIIDCAGVGSLTSAIADRAPKQLQEGFTIFALRDLYAQDYEERVKKMRDSGATFTTAELAQGIRQNIQQALQKRNCHDLSMNLYFSIMEVEAWLLAFTKAVSAWADVSESAVFEHIAGNSTAIDCFNFETIKRPSTCLQQIGNLGGKEYKKSHSLIERITREEINAVHKSRRNPSFTIFWDEVLRQLCH